MYPSPSPLPRAGEQEFAPLLFSLQAIDQATPRAVTPLRTAAESSISTQRRSATPPGSMHTDATPTPPPPIMRLADDVVMEDPGSAARSITPGGRTPLPSGPLALLPPPATTSALQFEQQQPAYDDVWVTVYGFSQQDVPLVLKEFHRCGEILNWGTFGQPAANFIHIQYQNKHGAQRALLRNGEQLSPTLIVGVKPLDVRHRQAIDSYQAGPDSPAQLLRPKAVPDRPYRVDVTAGQQVPQPSRSMLTKVYEFVLGV